MNEIGLIKKHGFQSEPQTIGHDNYFEKKTFLYLEHCMDFSMAPQKVQLGLES